MIDYQSFTNDLVGENAGAVGAASLQIALKSPIYAPVIICFGRLPIRPVEGRLFKIPMKPITASCVRDKFVCARDLSH